MGGENMKKYINFDVMITPVIIKILFWVGVAASIMGGIVMAFTGLITMFSGFEDSFIAGFGLIIGALFVMIGGTILTRIYCELIIVFFKMNERLYSIDEKLNKQNNIL